MTRTRYAYLPISLLACCFLLSVLPAYAGGPFIKCQSGKAFVWPNGGQNIPFNPDQGSLGPLSHDEAVRFVAGAFQVWADVPTATVTYENAGELPVDVDVTNFEPFLFPNAPDGLSPIVFDATGEIFDLLFGPNSGVVAIAGPEFVDEATCTITEGAAFLNGPAFSDSTAALDLMVHEFGHYANLGHTVVNGQATDFNDVTSPDPDLFPLPPTPAPPPPEIIATMFPSYLGPQVSIRTLHADDRRSLSTLYPAASFFDETGSISGTILAPNGSMKLTGVNVIARNIADPFVDASSAVSGDFTNGTEQSDPFVGTYTINGLTPGAEYVVFVDGILTILAEGGEFGTPINSPLPGKEEFFNGANESSDPNSDMPAEFESIVPAAGTPVSDVDIVFNHRVPGEPLPVPSDGAVQLFLPFPVNFCGETYDNMFVNGNGYVTFGSPGPPLSFTPNVPGFLQGPPRIAPLWTDLDPMFGGVITFEQNRRSLTVIYEGVPSFPATGANSFKLKFFRLPRFLGNSPNPFLVTYGDMTATNGIAGLSCGAGATTGTEVEIDLTETLEHDGFNFIDLKDQTAVFEQFSDSDNDLARRQLFYFEFPSFLRNR